MVNSDVGKSPMEQISPSVSIKALGILFSRRRQFPGDFLPDLAREPAPSVPISDSCITSDNVTIFVSSD